MSEIWQMTRQQFVGNWPEDNSNSVEMDRVFGSELEIHTEDWMRSSLRPVPGHRDYFFADIQGQPGDIAVLHLDDFDGEYTTVGYFVGGDRWDSADSSQIWIYPNLRGKGLGAELVIEKFNVVGGPICNHSYTTAGKQVMEAAHRKAVTRAFNEGYRIPGHVLNDYPELLMPQQAMGMGMASSLG